MTSVPVVSDSIAHAPVGASVGSAPVAPVSAASVSPAASSAAILLGYRESATAKAPASLGYLVQGILEHGDDDVRRRFLPGIVNGRDRWCQGFSEPDTGSDLASLRTRAERDGDDYVITGHKVWTSYSDLADWCFLLARTDADVAKHRGLSILAVRMDQPGVSQRPLPMINGITREFGEVILDGATVPAENMIGAPGEGWRLAMTVVSHEREPHERGGEPDERQVPGTRLRQQPHRVPVDLLVVLDFRVEDGSDFGGHLCWLPIP